MSKIETPIIKKAIELVVTKGKTVKADNREEWMRVEYSIKATVDGDGEVQVAKAQIEGLIDDWLSSPVKQATVAQEQAKPKSEPIEVIQY